ncbi:MAG: hypothetical protein V5A34_08835 [Halapricum sp.]
MNLTPAVRSIREDPIEGESVTLLIEVADEADNDAVAESIETVGGTVEDRRRFGTLVVTIAQERVDAVCSVEGIGVVETDNAVSTGPDGAGEDVEFESE